LVPGGEVRLRYAYIIKCEEIIKNDRGEVIELRCTYDPETRSGTGTSQKKVKGTIQLGFGKTCYQSRNSFIMTDCLQLKIPVQKITGLV